jgi:hypothetical protein
MKIKRVKHLFQRWVPMGWGGNKERVNEGEYGGCIFYSQMKVEKRNLSRLF